MTNLVNQVLLQRYRILELKNREATTETYLVHDDRKGSLALMKTLSRQASKDPEIKANFEQECELLERISSSCVINFLDHGEVNGVPYLLTEYVAGHTVIAYVDVAGRLRPEIALGIAWQAADSLSALHTINIIHRSLSPHTFVVNPQGKVILIDCKTMKARGGSKVTRPGFGLSVGSLPHMAPEVIQGEGEQRSDIYSLGATLFHMLTGAPPFQSDNLGELGLCILNQEAPQLNSFEGIKLPEIIESFLSFCLANDISQRPSSAKKFQEIISEFPISPANEEEIKDALLGVAIESIYGVLEHEPTGTRFELNKQSLTVGRKKDRDIALTPLDHKRVVHRRHAKIEKRGSDWVVIPEPNAVNGVWINDKRIPIGEVGILHNGDIIHFAAVALHYLSK